MVECLAEWCRQTIAPDGFTAEHFDELQKLFDRYKSEGRWGG